MIDQAKRAKEVYEVFCKLNTRNTVKKRGKVVCRDNDSFYTPEKAVENFYNAILKAEEQTALERVVLVALRDLPRREIKALGDRLKCHYLEHIQALEVTA